MALRDPLAQCSMYFVRGLAPTDHHPLSEPPTAEDEDVRDDGEARGASGAADGLSLIHI